MNVIFRCIGVTVFSMMVFNSGYARQAPNSASVKTIAAGKEYNTSKFHQWLWGKNYRKEWSTPVKLPVSMLDTLYGGVTPLKAGGGNQTKSLQVETKDHKVYTIRSVNKTLGKVLPDEFLGTFIEDLVDDKVSMSHPYASAAASRLANKAGIYHTYPKFIYVPKQPLLDTFAKFGNEVYLVEQKLSGDWAGAANIGGYSKYIGTDDLLEKRLEDHNVSVDQENFVKHRLFDMLINDWDRHEKQWEWATNGKGDKQVYQNIPQDRDQAFFYFEGALLKPMIGASGMKYFQPFEKTMKDVKSFNYEERNLDRFFANQLTASDWERIAKSLQSSITDQDIERALNAMPAEITSINNRTLAAKLKGRRDRIVTYAMEYYRFLAKEVEVTGSEKREMFKVSVPEQGKLAVNVFALSDRGISTGTPIYSRTFTEQETKEVRLFGINGTDVFSVEGDSKIRVRLIGGFASDSITANGSTRVHVYDDKQNVFNTGSSTKFHLGNDSAVHEFKYDNYLYNKKGIKPTVFYTNEDRLYVGIGYGFTTHKWRKEPFAFKHDISLNYSLSQKGISVIYKGLYPNFIGKWDLDLNGIYDAIRWTNYFGVGNDTKFVVNDINYYRARTEEWLASVGLQRKMGDGTLRINGLFQQVRVLNDADKFTGATLPYLIGSFEPKRFGGAQVQYRFFSINDPVVPTKGLVFSAKASYLQNLEEGDRHVGNFEGQTEFFVPLAKKFSLALRAGGQTLTGKPEFYQLANVGGGQQLRGFRQTRFFGESAFYNSNELRFINDVKSYIFNGKAGLVAFFDNGRVWNPGEKSDTWHMGYGGGILLAPFNKILADITYGISKDESLLQLRLTLPLK